jgi:hypothetical protein
MKHHLSWLSYYECPDSSVSFVYLSFLWWLLLIWPHHLLHLFPWSCLMCLCCGYYKRFSQ